MNIFLLDFPNLLDAHLLDMVQIGPNFRARTSGNPVQDAKQPGQPHQMLVS